jgi:hypothetical protein
MWLGDVVESVRFFSSIVLCFAVISIMCFVFVESLNDGEHILKRASSCGPLNWSMVVIVALLTLVPSKVTIHSFVALKAGEEMLKTEMGGKAYSAISSVLDKITNENKAEKK